MFEVLEVTGQDIKDLNDSDLRSLIGRLCEAECHLNGISSAGVTFGGHQNAKDGGLDVRVELSDPIPNNSFIPRSITGFQVKKPDMTPTKIIDEMRPGGTLRNVIKDLAQIGGSYIIVSSQGSFSDSALKNRRKAMEEAVADIPEYASFKLDFYDRERVAAWVRSHPSLILWVRSKLGRPIQGWRPFENWSNPTQNIDDKYLTDGHIRLYNSSLRLSGGANAAEGINELRKILHIPKSAIRLVGLSGVGKTRLVQALFDERIGENSLNPARVFYCDIANRPNPDPQGFATQLVALNKPSILVVDNCPPALHKNLVQLCAATKSQVSVITVEYDVREDQPEETEVFRLEPASPDLIEKVIRIRFPYISQVCAKLIAEFSGGNARIAMALSKTVNQGEDISHLKDEDLFARLFHQRNDPDNELLSAAEVCSLVYSFDCQTGPGLDNELQLLSLLVDSSVRKLYSNVSELKRRDLVQQRGVWRAVLPHAIANKLAKRALENIPLDEILYIFENKASERFIRSFSRRLSFLHDSAVARRICDRWLSEDGLLGDVYKLNSLGISLLVNIAPVDPGAALLAIERVAERMGTESFFSRANEHYIEITRLLRSLAYDKDLFSRSVNLISRFAFTESANENQNSIRDILKSLFYIKLSGTHATAGQRLSVIERLLTSKQEENINLGLEMLGASLQASRFSTHFDFEFGAHSRNYGYLPRTKDDVKEWFKLFINYVVELATSELPFAARARNILAEKFRELWVNAGMVEEMYLAAIKISNKVVWKEGWIAVKATIRYDSNELGTDERKKLESLNIALMPTTLIELARMYALSRGHPYDLVDAMGIEDDDYEKSYETVHQLTRSMGKEVGSEVEVLIELLPELLSGNGDRLFLFGQGLAEGQIDPKEIWKLFKQEIQKIDELHRNYQIVRGFLSILSEINPTTCEDFLEGALKDVVWSIVFPILQSSVDIDMRGLNRLKQSLTLGKASIQQYQFLAYGRSHEKISDSDLSEILRTIASTDNGLTVSIEVLTMRLHGVPVADVSEVIKSLGRELVSNYIFSNDDNNFRHWDHALSKIIKICFSDENAIDETRKLCSRIIDALINHEIYYLHYDDVLSAIAATQPIVFLDMFLDKDIKEIRWFFAEYYGSKDPMAMVKTDIILDWCEAERDKRYQLISSVIHPYTTDQNEKAVGWTQIAKELILRAPDPRVVLDNFKKVSSPRVWSGSLASILESRLALISELKGHFNIVVSQWAHEAEIAFQKEIEYTRQRELRTESQRNETFE